MTTIFDKAQVIHQLQNAAGLWTTLDEDTVWSYDEMEIAIKQYKDLHAARTGNYRVLVNKVETIIY